MSDDMEPSIEFIWGICPSSEYVWWYDKNIQNDTRPPS